MTVRPLFRLVFAALVTGHAGVHAQAQLTSRESVSSAGDEANLESNFTSTSDDGRFIAFASRANNLAPGADTNNDYDIFVRDRQLGLTTRVSVDSAGVGANFGSQSPSITPDGRFVAFHSFANNLVAGDTNNTFDVFVHDRETAVTSRVSIRSDGGESDDESRNPSISADGRWVAFESDATNLVPGDRNGARDIFLHDRQRGRTTRVSLDSSGVEGNDASEEASLAGDGELIVFQSCASNLVVGDTNAAEDVFLHDRLSGVTTRLSVDALGNEGDDDSSTPAISLDGLSVSFHSKATNLVAGDTNASLDVFVHELATGTTDRISVDSSGQEGNGGSSVSSISKDSRSVSFSSLASSLVAGDTNGVQDIFLHDRDTGRTTRASVNSLGIQGNLTSWTSSISLDGRAVSFFSTATNLVQNDSNGVLDVFVHGPALTLEASPDVVTAGDAITLITWTGQPSGLAMLVAVDIDGSPIFLKLLLSTFDNAGLLTLPATVPPGLAGVTIGLQTIGVEPDGKLGLSNIETITFQ